MSSIAILKDRLEQTEFAMESLREQIDELNGTIEANIEHRDKITTQFNRLDEDTVELKEAIELLKKHEEYNI